MRNLQQAASIDDLRQMAQRRLPAFAFDFIDGGAEDELNLHKNRTAFDDIELLPRYLTDVSQRDLSTDLFGRTYQVPFGVAPVGFMNTAWPDADAMLARLAAQQQMPYIISTASSTSLETLATLAQGHAWFQLYYPGRENIYGGLLERAHAAQIDVLVVTVDVSSPGKRDRDIRNRLRVPFKLTPQVLIDLALHPRWALATARHGAPNLANILPYTEDDARTLASLQAELISASLDWDTLARIRSDWSGHLLVKGLLHPDDALRAMATGCDGIVVSNHGGRQIAFGPAAVAALPAISTAIAGKIPVLLDSGIMRGADIVRAAALGASLSLAGRAFAFGAGAGAEPGVARAYDILHTELDRAVGQLGCSRFSAINQSYLFHN